MTEEWIVFRDPDGRELYACTVRGSFDGELEATKELLAAEKGPEADQIAVKIERR